MFKSTRIGRQWTKRGIPHCETTQKHAINLPRLMNDMLMMFAALQMWNLVWSTEPEKAIAFAIHFFLGTANQLLLKRTDAFATQTVSECIVKTDAQQHRMKNIESAIYKKKHFTPDCATPRRLNPACKPNHEHHVKKEKSPLHAFEMVWNNPPFLPRHVTTLSSTARRHTNSHGETVTVSSKFRNNGTHGECVGNNATIRSWETTWTALRSQHSKRPFSNLVR